MANALLTDEEKGRIRYHLGYPQTDRVSSIQLGAPAFGETKNMVDSAMERIPVAVIGIIRQLVQILDRTEANIIDAQEFLVASSAGGVDINHDHIEQLRIEYAHWAKKLADNLACPINQFAAAFQGSVNSINIPVLH
jgi:hypothetical protein